MGEANFYYFTCLKKPKYFLSKKVIFNRGFFI